MRQQDLHARTVALMAPAVLLQLLKQFAEPELPGVSGSGWVWWWLAWLGLSLLVAA